MGRRGRNRFTSGQAVFFFMIVCAIACGVGAAILANLDKLQ